MIFLSVKSILVSLLLINRYALAETELVSANAMSTTEKAVLDILSSTNYSKFSRPGTATDPTLVKVNMYIRKVDKIDDIRMELSMQITLRQIWTDPRLRYNNTSFPLIEYVTIDDSQGNVSLWSPDIFFGNEVSAFVHTIMKPNSYKRVYPDGRVIWSTRLTSKLSCPMDLRLFPFDKQMCPVSLMPYSLTSKDLILQWDNDNGIDPVTFSIPLHQRRFSKFDLIKHETGTCKNTTVVPISGRFSCIVLYMSLERQSGMYLSMIYLPSSLCILLSWITFWLGNSISTRLSLTLTLLLTMATQIQGINERLPQVSYNKAIDYWTAFTTISGALAIFETAVVAYLLKRKEVQVDIMMEKLIVTRTMMLDKVSRVLFPAGFILFCIVYVLAFVVGNDFAPIINV